jgi:hypothetical protein
MKCKDGGDVNLQLSLQQSGVGIVRPSFSDGTVTGAECLNMLEVSIVPNIHHLYGDEEICYQQDAPISPS